MHSRRVKEFLKASVWTSAAFVDLSSHEGTARVPHFHKETFRDCWSPLLSTHRPEEGLGYIHVHHGPLRCTLSCLMTAQLHCDPQIHCDPQFTWGNLLRGTSVYLSSLKRPLCWPEQISVHLRGVEVSVKASLCVNISSLTGHDQSLKDSLLT